MITFTAMSEMSNEELQARYTELLEKEWCVPMRDVFATVDARVSRERIEAEVLSRLLRAEHDAEALRQKRLTDWPLARSLIEER